MRRRSTNRRKPWVPVGQDHINGTPHDEYHDAVAQKMAAFDALPEAVKELTRNSIGGKVEGALNQARKAQMEAERDKRLREIEEWKRGGS